jgi:hypothetical protein
LSFFRCKKRQKYQAEAQLAEAMIHGLPTKVKFVRPKLHCPTGECHSGDSFGGTVNFPLTLTAGMPSDIVAFGTPAEQTNWFQLPPAD